LPHTAQDSVLDCWLSFVKAVIADHCLPCAYKAQPSSNRTFSFPEYGFPIIFIR
jgi:hypothetical protein